jgi:tripartite-type tricarboxylate transporter receptor subunit TctC
MWILSIYGQLRSYGFFILCLCALVCLQPRYALAAAAKGDFPNRTVRLLIGFSPGGGTDLAARIIVKKLTDIWGQTVVVDNRAGAGGLVAFEMTAKANPDGYTLLATSPSFAIQPTLALKLPYDPYRDFAPVTQATAAPYLLVVYPGLEAKSVKELVDLAKAQPGRLSYASGGIGSAQHLAAELFVYMAGIKMLHVPFKGAGNVTEVMSGRVQALFSGLPQGMPHIQAGRLRALGVTTLDRATALPQVPTIAESGVPGYNVVIWYGVLTTGGTPKPIVDILNAGFVQALKSPEIKQQLTGIGLDPVGNSSVEFSALVRSEILRWSQVIKRSDIKAE